MTRSPKQISSTQGKSLTVAEPTCVKLNEPSCGRVSDVTFEVFNIQKFYGVIGKVEISHRSILDVNDKQDTKYDR
jgi:hypothetical protein